MDINEILRMTNRLIFENTGEYLSDLQAAILYGSLQGQSYAEIAGQHLFSESHVKNVANHLWRELSEILGMEVKKKNVRSVFRNMKNEISSSYSSSIVSGICQQDFTINNHLSFSHEEDKSPVSASSPPDETILDLKDIPAISQIYQRPGELETLKTWILQDRIPIITLLGLSGIGKTALALTLIEQIKTEFHYIIYRSLDSELTLDKLLQSILATFVKNSNSPIPENSYELRQTFIDFLRSYRCLIVFDDVHNILSSGELVGNYRLNQKPYSSLFQQIAKLYHQSCLILLGWEPPIDMITLSQSSQNNHLVKLITLSGLDPGLISQTWQEIGLEDPEQWPDIIKVYQGNPLWLNLIAGTIENLFNGSASEFSEISPLFLPTELNSILQRHWQRLSDIELKIVEILRKYTQGLNMKQIYEQAKLDEDKNSQVLPNLANGIQSLIRRGLVEKQGKTKGTLFTLLPILKYF